LGTGDLILTVDGDSDTDTQVTFQIGGGSSGWTFGRIEGDEFESYTLYTPITVEGNTSIDFAIQKDSDPTIIRDLSHNDATISFLGQDLGSITGSTSQKPSNVQHWYRNVTLDWGSEANYSFQVAAADGTNDGFTTAPSPGSTVPIPASAFLLGTGAIGLIGIRRKFMK
jgi:hypothetical protein